MGSHVVVNSSIKPRLKSTRLIDGEVKGIMDNLASQERIVVNGRHCVDTEKSLCTQENGCVNTTLFDWCTHRFCALIHGFLV